MNENELLAEMSNYDDSLHDQLVDEKEFGTIAEETTPQQQIVPELDKEEVPYENREEK